MYTDKEQIKSWLKSIKKDRAWLAEQCEASKRTVDNWLAETGILPSKALLQINRIIKQFPSEVLEGVKPEQYGEDTFKQSVYCIPLPYDIARALEENALAASMTLSQYCASLLEEVTKDPEIESKIMALRQKKSIESRVMLLEEELPYIDVIGQIAAGGFLHGDAEHFRLTTKDHMPVGSYALRVVGDSMEPAIMNNDIVVVKPWRSDHGLPPLGKIVVFHDERGITLKKLSLKNDKYVLTSINPKYADIEPLEEGSYISAIFYATLRELEPYES